jgi:hypothetical protein
VTQRPASQHIVHQSQQSGEPPQVKDGGTTAAISSIVAPVHCHQLYQHSKNVGRMHTCCHHSHASTSKPPVSPLCNSPEAVHCWACLLGSCSAARRGEQAGTTAACCNSPQQCWRTADCCILNSARTSLHALLHTLSRPPPSTLVKTLKIPFNLT